MNKKTNICLALAIMLLLSACGIFKHEKKSLVLTQDLYLDNTATFINGCKEKIIGNYDKAVTLFLSCLKTDPSNAAAKYELAGIYYLQKKYKEASPLIEQAVKLEPTNDWYKLLYANILIAGRYYKDATAIYAQLAKEHPENAEYFFNWAEGYLYMGNYQDAIDVYDKLETKMGVSDELSMQKQKLYTELKKPDKAEVEIQKLIDKFPSETSYYNALADLYLTNKKTEKAYEMFQKILVMDPKNANVHLSLAEYYRVKGRTDKSFDELKLAFSNANLDIDTKIKILLSYYLLTQNSDQLKTQAYDLIDILIKTHPGEAKAYSMYADFLYRDKRVKEAKEEYEKVIGIDSTKYEVWEQLLLLESELNDNVALEQESKRAMALFPEQAGIYLFNGVANYMQKKYEEAVTVLNKGIPLAGLDENMLKQFYTYLGDSYYAQKNNKDAFLYFDKILIIDPKDVYILNNYSYYLSLLGQDLDKAEKMAKKAVGISEKESSFLDTYAWVLYKEAKYQDAETWSKKALDNKGDSNDIILEHYGDIMYKLGNTEKALEYWKKAREKGKGSEFLEKKISDKKLYE